MKNCCGRRGGLPANGYVLLSSIAALAALLPSYAQAQAAGPQYKPQSICLTNLVQALTEVGKDPVQYTWIDSSSNACFKPMCMEEEWGNTCASAAPNMEELTLVFSDEFNDTNRSLSGGQDSRWHAMNYWNSQTSDTEVYVEEMVTVSDGALKINIQNRTRIVQAQNSEGNLESVLGNVESGMVQSWNKFCFTGGYLEASVMLPGDWFYSGFWPAFWMMGNLARAGYPDTTEGMWPYSFDECLGSLGQKWSDISPQQLSECATVNENREFLYGMRSGQGRGAPEIDVFEVRNNPANMGTPENPGPNYMPPQAVTSLQMAPLMPKGTHWDDAEFYETNNLYPGAQYPGLKTYGTNLTQTQGPLTGAPDGYNGPPRDWLPRPGNLYTDSMGAQSNLNESYFQSFHTFGVNWQPGEFVRWYIDDVFVFELNKNALAAQSNTEGEQVGQRSIPVEAMYIIFNIAMSQSWVTTSSGLNSSAQMAVDYIRLYQDLNNEKHTIGCSPPDYPTSQFIVCNREHYLALDDEEASLVPDCCRSDLFGCQNYLLGGMQITLLTFCLAAGGIGLWLFSLFVMQCLNAFVCQ